MVRFARINPYVIVTRIARTVEHVKCRSHI